MKVTKQNKINGVNQTITTEFPSTNKSTKEITTILHELCDENSSSQFISFLSDLNIDLDGDYTFTCNIVSGGTFQSLEIKNIREKNETHEKLCKICEKNELHEAINEESHEAINEQTHEEVCEMIGICDITGQDIRHKLWFSYRNCECTPGMKHHWYMNGDPKKYLHREGKNRGWYKCSNCEKWGNDYAMINQILYGSLN